MKRDIKSIDIYNLNNTRTKTVVTGNEREIKKNTNDFGPGDFTELSTEGEDIIVGGSKQKKMSKKTRRNRKPRKSTRRRKTMGFLY